MGSLGFLGLEYEPEFAGRVDHLFTVILAEESVAVTTARCRWPLEFRSIWPRLLSPSMELPGKKRNTPSLRCREQTSALSQERTRRGLTLLALELELFVMAASG